PPPAARPWDLLVLSARSETALAALAARLADHLERHPDLELADVAHTLQQGRRALPWRRVVAARDTGSRPWRRSPASGRWSSCAAARAASTWGWGGTSTARSPSSAARSTGAP